MLDIFKKKQAPKLHYYFIAYAIGAVFANTIIEARISIADIDTIRYLENQIALNRQRDGSNLEKDLEKIVIISFTPL